jgi:hypothetical protein
MSQVHGVGPITAIVGVAMIFCGGVIAARDGGAGANAQQGTAHWQQALARFNSRAGNFAGYVAGAGVVVVIVGLIIWAL